MPLLDMSLAELKEYEGRNPRPTDFTEYWEAALKELRETDPQVELVPSEFTVPYAECFDLFFTGVRGLEFMPNISGRKQRTSLILRCSSTMDIPVTLGIGKISCSTRRLDFLMLH